MMSGSGTKKPAIVIMGPTASGKTDLALKLNEQLPCRIISVDSAMVYRGMDIGTAKPEPEILASAPHHLIDILDPSERYSAANFRQDALNEMKAATAQERIPLLVGGTMLYFRALQAGLSELPSADPELRLEIEAQARELGWAKMHQRLAQVDSESAQRIHPNDPQRIQRALEVFEITGKPLTEHFRDPVQNELPYKLIKVVVSPSQREILHARIATRFDQMMEQGFVDEVSRLKGRGDLDLAMPSMRAVGYRQVWEYLEGERDFDDAVERAVIATRQLAKRQLTWLRSETEVEWFDPCQSDYFEAVWHYIGTALDQNCDV